MQYIKRDTKRILFIDYARTFALFLVVFAHLYSVFSPVRVYIYAFHMPLFFLMSGYLHRNANTLLLTKKMIKKILIPFIFFLLVGYIYFVLTSADLRIDVIYESIMGVLLGDLISANSVLWFLLAIFFVRIIGNIFIKNSKVIVFPTLLLFVFFTVSKYNLFYLGTSFMALPFYLIGHYGGGIDRVSTCSYSVIIAIIFLGVSFLISYYNGKVSMMGMGYGFIREPLNILLFYINGVIGSMSILCVAGAFTSESKIVNWVSRSSISIVGLQSIPLMIWKNSIGIDQNYFISLLYTILILIICVMCHFFIEKKASWLLGIKHLP